MLNRNKHPYKIDERFLSGKVVVMYVRYRFFHNWVFIALTLFWLSFSLLIFSLIWNEGFIRGFCIIPWIKMLNYPSISTKLS